MSSKFIVRQPIKDIEDKTIGYEILYHGENEAYTDSSSSGEYAVGDTVYQFLMQNTDKLFKGSVSFMTFTPTLLVKKTPRLFDKHELVIQIDDSVVIHPLAMHLVQQYSKDGYKIAVNEFQFAPRYLALLDYIQYIKMDFHAVEEDALRNILDVAHSLGKKVIAIAVDDEEKYCYAVQMGADALEGSYVAQRLAVRSHTSSYLQSNFFQLMVAVTRDEPDVEEIENTIARDASLTYGLLKMANSAYFAPRRRITNIQQAIMMLGMGQLKQWVYLLSTSSADDQITPETEEFLKISFLRANFCCELMNYIHGLPITRGEAYLMGMFSMLNHLIDAPLEEILAQVPVAPEICDALLHGTGPCGLLFDLVLQYERANWGAMVADAEKLGLETRYLTSVYFNCMEKVNTVWNQLTVTADGLDEAPAEDDPS